MGELSFSREIEEMTIGVGIGTVPEVAQKKESLVIRLPSEK
tara:strand:- start:779 stop:901 length:123 start_codon:yes stop_codon:yes gene_type:complete